MRIHDEQGDRSLSEVALFLTVAEAVELRDSLNGLLSAPRGNHAHVSDADYKKEITVCVYDPDDLTDLHVRAQRLIQEDR